MSTSLERSSQSLAARNWPIKRRCQDLAGCEVELLKLPLCTSLKLTSDRIHSLNHFLLGQDGVPAAGAEPTTVPSKPTSSPSDHQACARICQPCRNFRNRMHNSVERVDGMGCSFVTGPHTDEMGRLPHNIRHGLRHRPSVCG